LEEELEALQYRAMCLTKKNAIGDEKLKFEAPKQIRKNGGGDSSIYQRRGNGRSPRCTSHDRQKKRRLTADVAAALPERH
jgi:hypothetical protein